MHNWKQTCWQTLSAFSILVSSTDGAYITTFILSTWLWHSVHLLARLLRLWLLRLCNMPHSHAVVPRQGQRQTKQQSKQQAQQPQWRTERAGQWQGAGALQAEGRRAQPRGRFPTDLCRQPVPAGPAHPPHSPHSSHPCWLPAKLPQGTPQTASMFSISAAASVPVLLNIPWP